MVLTRSLILVFPETFTHTRRVFPGHTFSLTFGCVFSSAFSLPIYTNPLSTFSMRFLVQSLFHPCRVKFTVCLRQSTSKRNVWVKTRGNVRRNTRKTTRKLTRELSSVLMGDLARQIRRELENTQGNSRRESRVKLEENSQENSQGNSRRNCPTPEGTHEGKYQGI